MRETTRLPAATRIATHCVTDSSASSALYEASTGASLLVTKTGLLCRCDVDPPLSPLSPRDGSPLFPPFPSR